LKGGQLLTYFCSECKNKLDILHCYRHPIRGREKNVCGICWDSLDKSEKEYSSFISHAVEKKKFGCICFILISTSPAKEHDVYDKLMKLPEIIELHPLLGWYDLIAKIGIDNPNFLGEFVIDSVRKIEGITDTRTLTGAFSLKGS
jgi:DNA-binding Lrp family transcriptional regulator